MFGRTWYGLLCLIVWALLFLALGCSELMTPLAPDEGGMEEEWPVDRAFTAFQARIEASDHENYTSISSTIGGFSGGTVSGTVTGYQNSFSITVPQQAFSGSREIEMLVPTAGVPVYQLLPAGEFDETVTVTLDYYYWITQGVIAHGDSCEVFFMNEDTEEWDTLSPRAVFVADSTASTVSFSTTHFSRWDIKDKD